MGKKSKLRIDIEAKIVEKEKYLVQANQELDDAKLRITKLSDDIGMLQELLNID